MSYRKVDLITKHFEFPIPRYDDAIAILNTGSQFIWIISLDAQQGYYQVRVLKVDREKLAFFAPDGWKYTFKVIPFGPTNVPAFYSTMMRNLKEEWDDLFIIGLKEITHLDKLVVIVSITLEVHIGGTKLVFGTKISLMIYCYGAAMSLLYLFTLNASAKIFVNT